MNYDIRKQEVKITNEKPISLFPLDFKEAVAALLKVKPPAKEKGSKKAQGKNKR